MCECERCEISWGGLRSGEISLRVYLFVYLVLALVLAFERKVVVLSCLVLFCFMREGFGGGGGGCRGKGSGDEWRSK